MGQILGIDWVADLVIASATSITMAQTYQGKQVRVTVGGQQYAAASGLTLNLAATGFNGLASGSLVANTLYYIYAVVSSGVLGLIASTSGPAIGPTGFATWKEIGRFRTYTVTAAAAAIVNRAGPGTLTQSQLVSPNVAYAPNYSAGFGGVTSNLFSRQVADKLHISGRFQVGTVAGTVASITYPNGLHAGIGAGAGNGWMAGKWSSNNAVANSIKQGVVMAFPGDTVFYFSLDDYVNTANAFVASNANSIISSTNTISFDGEVIIPIAEWQGLFD